MAAGDEVPRLRSGRHPTVGASAQHVGWGQVPRRVRDDTRDGL